MALLNPYLSFPNKCLEAMTFYQGAIGGELTIQKVGEMPEMAAQMPPHMKDSVLHAMLKSGEMVVMASDLSRENPVEGNTFSLCINCNTEEELNSFFSKLSEGGKVIQPIGDMPWGAKYAEIMDKFGKTWMFNFQLS